MRTHMTAQVESQERDGNTGGRQGQAEAIRNRETLVPDVLDTQGTIIRVPGQGAKYVDPFALTALPNRRDATELFSHCKYTLETMQGTKDRLVSSFHREGTRV
jgi:hypothetical protein